MSIIDKRTVLGHVIVSLSDIYPPSKHRGLFELGFAPLHAPRPLSKSAQTWITQVNICD